MPPKLLETKEFQMAVLSPKRPLSDLSKGRRKGGRGGEEGGGGEGRGERGEEGQRGKIVRLSLKGYLSLSHDLTADISVLKFPENEISFSFDRMEF